MPADFITVSDLKRAWGRSERWILDAIHRGRLRAVRLGNRWTVTDAERERFEKSADFHRPEEPIDHEGRG
ncbi:MAG: hypothetical protein R3F35_01610 [Myxococcota bacterium]